LNAESIRPGRRAAPAIQRYSVSELNRAIGSLLERGFAPRFLLDATVSRPQLKKGHLWMTLTDGVATISAVVWASRLPRLSFRPQDGDGVTVVGSLNFWSARATLTVQIADLRPSLTAVLRRFEQVRGRLEPEGLFDPSRRRPLPSHPGTVAVLTSVPSSALADMQRTACERWPLARLLVVGIPVQGDVEERICAVLTGIAAARSRLGLEALVLARGGGSREDLSVFDGEALARALAGFPVPVVTGLGHEDDTTIADLVADHRAATPTAAIVALLPDRDGERAALEQQCARLERQWTWRLSRERERLTALCDGLRRIAPAVLLERFRHQLQQRRDLLTALSPQRLLRRGFALVRDGEGRIVRSVRSIHTGEPLRIELSDGRLRADVRSVEPRS
jgi:exodeoxyribonuclease VII large subunit